MRVLTVYQLSERITMVIAIYTWVSKVIRICFRFTLDSTALCDWSANFAPLSYPIKKTIVTRQRVFSRAFCRLYETAASFDWFWFYDTQSKTASRLTMLHRYCKEIAAVDSVITWWQQIKARKASAAGCSKSMSNDWRRSMSNKV